MTWLFGKKKATSIEKGKDDFVSLSSHELRSPLSIIKWYTEMLLDGDAGPLTEDQRKYLTVIESSNQRAIDLVRSLLNVSRLDLSTFSISPEDLSIQAVVSEVVEFFSSDAAKKNIEITREDAPELKNIQADKHICLLVLKQPIGNAIAFSKEGSKVVIKTSVSSSGESFGGVTPKEESIIVSITDTGLGIPPADQGKIFTKMFRGSNVEDTTGSDSGLGLYLAKTVMNLPYVEGDIWFTSEVGKGTTFYVAFPTKGMKKKEGKTVLE